MSNLNKAFIAAYRKNTAPVKAPGPMRVARSVERAPAAADARDPAASASLPAETISTTRLNAQASFAATPAELPPAPVQARIMTEAPSPAHSHLVFPAVPAAVDSPPPAPEPVAPAAVVADPHPARARRVIDTAHAGLPAPHVDFVEPQPHIMAITDGRLTPPDAPVVAPVPAAESPAASDAQAVNPRLVILPMTGPSPIWRPVFEVTNFTWPELTGLLLETAAAQFRAAATELAEGSRRHRKLIAVTAAHRGEGCTVVALALAKALAEQEQRVILVDAHFDAPRLADSLGMAPQVGWEEVLAGDRQLTEALVESLEDQVTVLPISKPAGEDWRLSVSRLKASFDELRRHCDLVLVDAGPLGESNDRRHLLSWAAPCRVDRALVVRDLRATDDVAVSDIEDRLHGCGIAQWNFVENFAA